MSQAEGGDNKMTTQYEYDADDRKYHIRTYCDPCRAEILAPFLGHTNVFGYGDVCTMCYDHVYCENKPSLDPEVILVEAKDVLEQVNRVMVGIS